MIEQDYLMRLIKEMIRAILKLLFNIDTDNPTTNLLLDEEKQNILNHLLEMMDKGNIDEAENRIYEMTLDQDMTHLKMALLFYSYLNDKDDDFLLEHNFSREEIQLGIKELTSRYGILGMEDIFLI